MMMMMMLPKAVDRSVDSFIRQIIHYCLLSNLLRSNVLRLHIQLVEVLDEFSEHGS